MKDRAMLAHSEERESAPRPPSNVWANPDYRSDYEAAGSPPDPYGNRGPRTEVSYLPSPAFHVETHQGSSTAPEAGQDTRPVIESAIGGEAIRHGAHMDGPN